MARFARNPSVVLVVLVAAAAAAAPEGGRRRTVTSLALKHEYQPIPPEHAALTSVPFAPGAPAVVLLEAMHVEAVDDAWTVLYQRRVKILTQAGVEDHADLKRIYYGDWRVKAVEARTVLPDGTVVDAAGDIHRSESKEDEILQFSVTWPRVQVGAILDFRVHALVDGLASDPWIVQEEIPVLESRYFLLPPPGFEHRAVVTHLPEEAARPVMGGYKEGKAFAWVFENQPPLPDLPWLPPTSDMAAQLILTRTQWGYGSVRLELASNWDQWGKAVHDALARWLTGKDGKVKALAASLAPSGPGALAVADAARVALRDRVRIVRHTDFWSRDTPDEVLEKGSGTSADLAAVTVAVLRARGIGATVAGIRHRDSGTLPQNMALPGLLDDVLVMLPGAGEGGKDVYFLPSYDAPVGELPGSCTGIFAIPYTKKSPGAVPLPDAPSSARTSDHRIDVRLDLNGNAEMTVVETSHGQAAHERRDELEGLTDEARREAVQDEIRDLIPSATLGKLDVKGAEPGAQGDVVITAEVTATGVAARAGDRLVLVPFVANRIDAADWAAETRVAPVEFGANSDVTEAVTVHLPPGVASVRLPQPHTMNAGDVGLYESTYSGEGATLHAKRRLRLDVHLFGPEQHPALRKWFLDMAAADDQAIVITVAP